MKHFVESNYQELKGIISRVNPALFLEIEKLSNADHLKVYKAKYPFGAMLLKKGQLKLIDDYGREIGLGDAQIDHLVREELSYGANLPMGLVLKNTLELYTSTNEMTVPWALFKEGDLFGLSSVLEPQYSIEEGDLWECTSGGRRVFSTLKIADQKKIHKLEKVLDTNLITPKSYSEQWQLLKDISRAINSSWYTEVLYFSKEWGDVLQTEEARSLRCFLHDEVSARSHYLRQKSFHDIVCSNILKTVLGGKNIFSQKLMSYLIAMSNGVSLGFKFSENDESLPLNELTNIFCQHYDTRGDYPAFVELSSNSDVLYYTLAFHLSPEAISSELKFSRKKDTLLEIIKLKDGLEHFFNSEGVNSEQRQYSLMKYFLSCDSTILHNLGDGESAISSSSSLISSASELIELKKRADKKGLNLSLESPFFNGLIRVSQK